MKGAVRTRGASPGSVVKLGMKWPNFHGREGDVLRSSGGSLYEIVDARPPAKGGEWWRLECVKLPSDAEIEDPIEFGWLPRKRRVPR